jgi:hypothetical protein
MRDIRIRRKSFSRALKRLDTIQAANEPDGSMAAQQHCHGATVSLFPCKGEEARTPHTAQPVYLRADITAAGVAPRGSSGGTLALAAGDIPIVAAGEATRSACLSTLAVL